jgi:hypothetical protein
LTLRLCECIRRLVTTFHGSRRRGRPSFLPILEHLESRLTPSVTFANQESFSAGTGPDAVAVADFNGDGHPDLAVTNPSTDTVTVDINSGTPGSIVPSFNTMATYAVGSGPTALAVGDFNSDGKPDLVVANANSGTVSVLMNTTPPGQASSSFANQVTFNVGPLPEAVAVGDFNGDGKPDIAVLNYTGTVSVLLNTTATDATTPSFASAVTFAAGTNPTSLAVGDFNGDGRPDIVVINHSGTASVLLNTTVQYATTPSFATAVTFPVGNYSNSVAVGDFNGDGRPDIAVTGLETVSVLMNTTATGATTASFAPQQTFPVTNPESLTVGDFNGDGRLDIAVAAENPEGAVSVLMNTTMPGATTASFAYQQTFAVGNGTLSVAVGYFNADGRPDLITANSYGNSVSVLLNTTTPFQTILPSFSSPQNVSTNIAGEPGSVAVGDFNGDGRPDLVIANFDNGTVSVLLNTTPIGATTPTFTETSFSLGSATLQPDSVAVGDFNGDGKPDIVVALGATSAPGEVAVLMNTTPAGATIPSFSGPYVFDVGNNPDSVVVGDFNGDGRPDIAVADNGSNTVSVLVNLTGRGPTPSFAPYRTFAVGTSPTSLGVGDFNGDGLPDLVATADNVMSVLLNTTTPGAPIISFGGLTTFPLPSSPTSVAVGDVNGDGRPDIVLDYRTAGTLAVLLNTTPMGASTPSFSGPTTFPVSSDPEAVVVTDVNGDGRPDLVVVGGTQDSAVSVLLNITPAGASTPAFASALTFPLSFNSQPVAAAVADFNGDGRSDLAVAYAIADEVSVLLNTSAQSTLPVAQFGSPGVWAFNSFQNALTGLPAPSGVTVNADLLAVNAAGNVAADFPGFGLFDFSHISSTWNQLNPSDPAALVIDNQGDVFAAYNGGGVLEYTPGFVYARVLNGANASSLAVDANGDLFAAFPAYGVLEFARGASLWQVLNFAGATVVAVDAPGDVVAASFPGYGVYRYLTANAQWTALNGVTASVLALDSTGDLAAAFPGYGLLAYARTAASWRVVNSANASGLAVDSANDFFVQFPGYGLLEYGPGLTGGKQLTLNNVTSPVLDSYGDVFGIVAGQGIFRYTLANGWSLLEPGNFSLLAVDASGDVAADLPGSGVFEYLQSTGTWTQLNMDEATALAIDDSGDVFAAFPGAGVFEYVPGIPDARVINTADASSLAVDAFGNVYAVFPGAGVLEGARGIFSWKVLNTATASVLAVDAAGDVAAEFPGYGVLEYSSTAGSWTLLNGANASTLAIDGSGAVVAEFPDYGVLLRYTSATGWLTLYPPAGATAAQIHGDVNGDVFVGFPGVGIFLYTVGLGFTQVTGTQGDASVLA